jgi:hypothetical protein
MKQFNIKQVIEADKDYSIRVVSDLIAGISGKISLIEKALNYPSRKRIL